MKITTLLAALTVSLSVFSQAKKQDPVGPFPYKAEEITIVNKTDTITLAGTLTLPEKGKNFPVVLLLSGSGPQDRNSEIMGHKPFLVLADYLTRNGIAVLRLDDRETGSSTGVYNKTGINGLVHDAQAAINYLKTRKEIDKSKIGVLGHSLGGAVAEVIASQVPDTGFAVLIGAPGLDGDKLMLLQKELIERKMGLGDAQISTGQKQIGGAYTIISQSTQNDAALTQALSDYFTETFGSALPQSQINTIASQLSIPWFADLIRFKPDGILKKIKCPVLALNGSNDLQVPPQNLAAIKASLNAGGNNAVTIAELPKLNHLLQESETGMPNEYGKLEQTISPDALVLIANWIKENTK